MSAVIHLKKLHVEGEQPDWPFLGARFKALRVKGATLCHARLQNILSGGLLVRVFAEASEEMDWSSSHTTTAQERASTGPRLRPLQADGWVSGRFIYSDGFAADFRKL